VGDAVIVGGRGDAPGRAARAPSARARPRRPRRPLRLAGSATGQGHRDPRGAATRDRACSGLPTVFDNQQNDGRSLDGDPQGIAPYAVTKWAAQSNEAPGILDLRGGTHIGTVNTTTSPSTTSVLGGVSYEVLNPEFTTGTSASFGRIFFNAVRNDAPQALKDVFTAGGYLCQHADEFLVPFGNTPLGNDASASRYCGQAN
jgi:hypothetical protein